MYSVEIEDTENGVVGRWRFEVDCQSVLWLLVVCGRHGLSMDREGVERSRPSVSGEEEDQDGVADACYIEGLHEP